MNPNLFFSALRARFSVFGIAFVATVLVATLVSLLMPKTYRATTSLVVDTKEEQSLSSALLTPERERLAYIQTQVDIITSEKVARMVVNDLKLAQNEKTRELFEKKEGGRGSIEDWLAAALIERLKVETSQSSIIQVTFTHGDPLFAAQVANAFAKAYIDTMLELRVQPTKQAAIWFDEQLKTLRANLEATQSKLNAYQRREGIVATDERLDVELSRLTELSTQLVKAQDLVFDLQSREQLAGGALSKGTAIDQLPDVSSNSQIQKLNADLLNGEARLQEMAAQYGVNYPLYQRQLAENNSRRQRLDAEMRKVIAGISSARRQNQERVGELKKAIAAQRARLLELKENRGELVVLTRDAESAQRGYETAMQRYVVSQVESRASQTHVSVLNPATAPRKSYRPRVGLNVALSVVVGTMLGIGIVILLEMSDRRVRSRMDLDVAPAVPVLGVLNAWKPSERLLLSGPGGGVGRVLPNAV
jgi:chain length determinant protein EpsF